MKHIIFLLFLYISLYPITGYSVPKIIATINPIYSLVDAVTEGVTKPVLLINQQISIHDYMLKPSDKRKIRSSNVIFYVDDHLETFINKIKDKTLIKLSDVVALLPSRYDSHFSYKVHTTSNDLHIWLSPDNAKKIVEHIKLVLCKIDPENAEVYDKNARLTIIRITELAEKIKQLLNTVKTKPYVVTHDAYQYFEKYFGLNFITSLSSSHNTNISVKKLAHIQKVITKNNISCIFSESQNDKIRNLFSQHKVTFQILDPIGNILQKESYFDIMQNIANNFFSCLSTT
ncbi:high-affinity zinc uptake system protein znuA [Ehrlichia ruminantium]|uniref:zinc ABC transporter substrate-binding protein n=1 Tax=Ehrlichia ruminantium TaxID=779 RepID=UPI0007C10735|nr:metal ABC transporter substrate-binding protein [Ehrlichia ruminantium]QLK52185.1 zinc ABC transporter substrate-binding protein [Ehrlichia ruminantium]QLK54016.1 zinc ABC transporter substrate-binding protein [Ehrlichia ruminantium]QLK56766.1 zinc ABC transporter substrate-binding protein [Ehrlichia ruminantium]GAT76074.1 high-affinity zinc uptake system protein znuA [Ehrlichia ruminantium]